jgi:hypothetical protein
MSYKISNENLSKLCYTICEDSEVCTVVMDCLKSFGHYHAAIYEMETWMKLHSSKNMASVDYRCKLEELSGRRTANHEALLSSVNILNRIAGQYGCGLIYEGVVSSERPYRREVADAVLAYVESVIVGRL